MQLFNILSHQILFHCSIDYFKNSTHVSPTLTPLFETHVSKVPILPELKDLEPNTELVSKECMLHVS